MCNASGKKTEHMPRLESIRPIDERFHVYSVNKQEANKGKDKKQRQANELVFPNTLSFN
jgi:hypothetical protein